MLRQEGKKHVRVDPTTGRESWLVLLTHCRVLDLWTVFQASRRVDKSSVTAMSDESLNDINARRVHTEFERFRTILGIAEVDAEPELGERFNPRCPVCGDILWSGDMMRYIYDEKLTPWAHAECPLKP